MEALFWDHPESQTKVSLKTNDTAKKFLQHLSDISDFFLGKAVPLTSENTKGKKWDFHDSFLLIALWKSHTDQLYSNCTEYWKSGFRANFSLFLWWFLFCLNLFPEGNNSGPTEHLYVALTGNLLDRHVADPHKFT